MNDLKTEEEQVEEIKDWIKKNGLSVLVAIVVGIVAVWGYQYWIEKKAKAANLALAEYSEINDMFDEGKNLEGAIKRAQEYVAKADNKTLSAFINLRLAKESINKKDYVKAEKYLNDASILTDDETISELVSYRLAKIAFAKKEYEKALGFLAKSKLKAYEAMCGELAGDIYFSKGELDKAKAEYQKAFDSQENGAAGSQTLKLKLEDLGGKTS